MLKLCVNQEEKIVLRGVTDEAWEYIEAKRSALYDAEYRHWCFSRERFGDTVYLTVSPYEVKTALLELLDSLAEQYGLETSTIGQHLLMSWRRDAENTRNNLKGREELHAADERIIELKRLFRDGCEHCENFRRKNIGDDDVCYCAYSKKSLYATHLDWEFGQVIDGVKQMGVKYFPNKECQFLNENEGRG